MPLRQVLGERLGVPVFVDNDATVAALAEAHDEELRLVARNLVMITVGTGVGGGIVLGGRIYRGATGGAGELGHTLVGLDLVGLVRAGADRHSPSPDRSSTRPPATRSTGSPPRPPTSDPDSALGRLQGGGQAGAGCRSRRGGRGRRPEAARRIVEVWAERVGIGIANAINTFDPEEVVIGGGAARAGELLLEPAKRVALGYVLPGLGQADEHPPGLARGARRRARRRAAGGAGARGRLPGDGTAPGSPGRTRRRVS